MRAELTHRQLVAHAPAAAAHPLNDKHVVLIDMRTHAAARYREGDHQIIQTPVRQDAERTHQLRGGHMPVVHRLRQQRPAGFAQIVKVLKRTIAGLRFTVEMAHQTAIDFRLHRQPCQLVRGNRVDKIREGIFQHYGLFLPSISQEIPASSGSVDTPWVAPVRGETGAIIGKRRYEGELVMGQTSARRSGKARPPPDTYTT